MDRALDEIVRENQRSRRGGGEVRAGGVRGGRGPRRDERRDNGRGDQAPPRNREWDRDYYDRKNARYDDRSDRKGIDDDWIHDRYDEERGDIRGGPRNRGERRGGGRRSPERERDEGVKIRVENLHYDLTQEDLEDLFTRIAPVSSLTLTYDRAGRSTGVAYVNYREMASAREAVREYDGANANGQPIRLTVVPSGPSAPSNTSRRNPFDTAIQPSRSLFERIGDGGSKGRGLRTRSRSPRRSDTTRPAPDYIDRYIPGERSSSAPTRRGRGGVPGAGRDAVGREKRDGHGRGEKMGEGARLPRKTQEQLDKEMDDYWNSKTDGGTDSAAAPVAAGDSMEVEMAE